MKVEQAHREVERVARDAFGRLVALLAARSGDLAAAEDALSEALVQALEHWPFQGVPERPEAWLLTVARRRLLDRHRRRGVAEAATGTLTLIQDELEHAMAHGSPWPDHRLGLLFACAEPAVEEAARTPLMLQVVLGIPAARIAAAFVVSPDAMGRSLSRAKQRLAASGTRFDIPEPNRVADRLPAVLGAVYAAFGLGWEARTGSLSEEAIWLGRTLAYLLPDEPEVLGLLALMLHAHARSPAARDAGTGAFVPLDEQDTAIWDHTLAQEADTLLRRAGSSGRPGRFQLEAAIQSVHYARHLSGRTDWHSLAVLHEALVAIAPTVGAVIAVAAARGEQVGALDGLAVLDSLNPDLIAAHQPYWATRAHLLACAGQNADAASAYQRAAGLSDDGAIRDWLLTRRARLLN